MLVSGESVATERNRAMTAQGRRDAGGVIGQAQALLDARNGDVLALYGDVLRGLADAEEMGQEPDADLAASMATCLEQLELDVDEVAADLAALKSVRQSLALVAEGREQMKVLPDVRSVQADLAAEDQRLVEVFRRELEAKRKLLAELQRVIDMDAQIRSHQSSARLELVSRPRIKAALARAEKVGNE